MPHVAGEIAGAMGAGAAKSGGRRRFTVSADWYADIARIVRETTPYQNEQNRWQFDHAGLKRRLVIDLDARGNPVMISYHPKRNL